MQLQIEEEQKALKVKDPQEIDKTTVNIFLDL